MVDHLGSGFCAKLERIDIHRSKLRRSKFCKNSELLKETMERSSGMERPISGRQTRSRVAARISSLTTTAVGRSGKREGSVKVRCLFSAVDDALVPPAFTAVNQLSEGCYAAKGQSDNRFCGQQRR